MSAVQRREVYVSFQGEGCARHASTNAVGLVPEVQGLEYSQWLALAGPEKPTRCVCGPLGRVATGHIAAGVGEVNKE